MAFCYDRKNRFRLRLTNIDSARKTGRLTLKTAEGTVAIPDHLNVDLGRMRSFPSASEKTSLYGALRST
ncbi:MAG: hypothetical protein IJ009_00170 [Clostridia bacterium]|nr:hypothetical protein [Clostridia bacterium]